MCLAGYAAYGGFSQANLNLNFPNNWMNVVSLLMQLPACLYLIYFTNLVLVLQVEIAFGVDPTEYLGGRWVFGMPPVLFRFVWRTAFLGSQVTPHPAPAPARPLIRTLLSHAVRRLTRYSS
mgnify:CR=1 FL=1